MDNLVKGIPYTACYLDDILVMWHTDDEHVANLDTVLQHIYDSGLRLRADKYQFMVLGEEKLIPDTAPAWIQWWALTLRGYRYKLIFVPGK